MLYVLIVYCSGFCPSNLPPPSDVLFFSSYSECQTEQRKLGITLAGRLHGSPIQTTYKQTCARMFADPKQLDRIIVPEQLEKLLADYKLHGDGWRPFEMSEIGPCGKARSAEAAAELAFDYSCLFRAKR